MFRYIEVIDVGVVICFRREYSKIITIGSVSRRKNAGTSQQVN